MNFGLIIIGDEILSGKREDKHLPKVIELLGARGLALGWVRVVGDDPERITTDLAQAFELARVQGDVVFSCGGIGATPDDHTRQCAARALGVPLAMHAQARELIFERMRSMAAEQGVAFDADRADNAHRLNMAVFPAGADIIPNPFNKIAGFSVRTGEGGIYFVPGFPVMAWPMIEWVLDERYGHLHRRGAYREMSVIVFSTMEATLTPLMQDIEARFAGVKVFSLPSVDHPTWGRHVELGVKGAPGDVAAAYADMMAGLRTQGAPLGPELVR
jgi:molybdopterin-biosynthesis enzyme MoeA-like protein